jgi:hypothetical protein
MVTKARTKRKVWSGGFTFNQKTGRVVHLKPLPRIRLTKAQKVFYKSLSAKPRKTTTCRKKK